MVCYAFSCLQGILKTAILQSWSFSILKTWPIHLHYLTLTVSDMGLSLVLFQVMVGDAVWPKYVKDCTVYMYVLQHFWWRTSSYSMWADVILCISVLYSGTEVTQLLRILSLVCLLYICDFQTRLRLAIFWDWQPTLLMFLFDLLLYVL